jgi:Uncharacterised nucleotidyltransferase
MESFAQNHLRQICSSPEAELLLHCARVRIEPERAERIRSLSQQDLNWDSLLLLALRNGLLPLLSHHLNKICPTLVPPDRLDYLRDYFRKNNAFNLLLTGELVRLLKVFASEGIRALPYKGPAVAVGIYGDLSLRQFCDLDILVREPDVWKATELLSQQGFEPHFIIPPEKQEAFVRLGYVRLFRRDEGRMVVELHWRVAPRFFDVPLDTEKLWERLQTVNLLGSQVLFPAAEDLLLMLCVHAAKDFWEKLEWVSSIAELLRAHPEMNWKRMLQQAGELHSEQMLLVGLSLANQLLDGPLPEHLAARVKSSATTLSIAHRIVKRFFATEETGLSFSSRLAFHLRFKDRGLDKLRYCTRLAFTTTPIDWATMPLPRPLSFLYLPLRAVRLAKRYGLDAGSARS